MKNLRCLMFCFCLLPLGLYSQYELFTAMKLDEMMRWEVFSLIEKDIIIEGEQYIGISYKGIGDSIDYKTNNSRTENIADRMELLSDRDKVILNQLYGIYYKKKGIKESFSAREAQQLIAKLDPRANFNSVGSPTGFGISQSQLITAIADVIVERAKQELAKSYFEKWASKMDSGIFTYYKDNKIMFKKTDGAVEFKIELSRIFPNTYQFLKNSEDYMTPEMGQTFKNTFTKDLESLFPNIIKYGLLEDYKDTVLIDDYTLASYSLIRKLSSNADFYSTSDDFLGSLVAAHESVPDRKVKKIQINVVEVLKLIRGLNQSLIDVNGRYVINVAQFRNADPAAFEAYLVMLSQNETIPRSIRKIIKDSANRETFNRFVTDMSRMQLSLKALSDAEERNEKIEALNLASKAFFDALKSGLVIHEKITGNKDYSELEQLIKNCHYGSDFTTSLLTGNYSASALVVLDFLNNTFEDRIDQNLFKYITLVADISHAESADEMRVIIDRAILPVGSYAIKRSTRFSVAINSYAGLGAGLEWVIKDGNSSYNGPSLGFALPIGVAVSWSGGTEDNMKASHTVFISMLDLGAVANYNLGTENSDDEEISISTSPEITFANVFSPGLSYVHGFKNSPLALSAGVQYMPKLREIKGPDDITVGKADAFQARIGFLVDIPLFNLVMRGKKDKKKKNKKKKN